MNLSHQYTQRREIIKKIYKQQEDWFNTETKPTDRIVSIHKHYVRPIVRGKQSKPVEFGAKANKFQMDEINFIEHISFDAFNEGTHFISTISKAQSMTNVKVEVVGADGIHATNKNRVFATEQKLKTDFKSKGRPSKDHKQVKQLKTMITKE